MRTYKTEGIIIRRRNYKESDRMLTIFTKNYGKLRVLAKGVRKIESKRGPNVEFFNRVQISLYNGKILDSLMEVKTVDVYPNLKQNLSTISKAWEMCELIDRLTREKQEHREVFYLMLDFLEKLEKEPKSVDMISFKLSLLRSLGFISDEEKLGLEIDELIEGIIERRLTVRRIYE